MPKFLLQNGVSMTDHNKIRSQLMDGAIKAVSEYGLEGLTTRSIQLYSGIKDAYIYRYFEDKEDLLRKTFIKIDIALSNAITDESKGLNISSVGEKQKCSALWRACWNYFVSHPDECKFYVRYYYSTYFQSQAAAEHNDLCKNLLLAINSALSWDGSCRMVVNQILDTILSNSVKVANGELENSEQTTELAFKAAYTILCTYLHSEDGTAPSGELSYLEFYSIVSKWV